MKHVISSPIKEQQHKENKYYSEISPSNNDSKIDNIKYNNPGSSSLDTSLTRRQQQEQNEKLSNETNINLKLNNSINNKKTSSSHDMNSSGVRVSASDCSYSESNFESEGIYFYFIIIII